MDKDIKKLIKLLKLQGRDVLADMLDGSTSYIKVSNQYGSMWNSLLSDFIIYLPIEKYVRIKRIVQPDRELLLEMIKDIYPTESDAPEIVDVSFRILDEAEEVKQDVTVKQNTFLGKSIRAFVSYSSKDAVVAGKVKSYLENYFGLEVFLAHEDIDGGDEWENVIVENLKLTDIFIPLISPNFEKSRFTDQETGMAFVLGKRIIPVSLAQANKPYGFVRKIQSLPLEVDHDYFSEWISFGQKIVEAIGKDPLFEEGVKNSIIRAFKNSYSFSFARQMVHLLKEYEPFDKQQANELIQIYLENTNVHSESYQVPSFIRSLIEQYFHELDKSVIEKLPKNMLPVLKDIADEIPF